MKILRGGLALLALAACKGSETAKSGDDAAGGTLVISTAADADVLFPPLVASSVGRMVTEQIFEPLATIGDSINVLGDEGFVPRLAERWEWAPDSMSIAFHINPRARWHDGVPVTARDVRYTHRIYMDSVVGAPGAAVLGNLDSVSVRDSLTAVVWFKHRAPQQFYDATAQMLILPEHVYGKVAPAALASSPVIRTPVGSGPFRFVRWAPGASIELAANPAHYRRPPKLSRVIVSVAPDPNAAATKLFTGAADVYDAMTPPQMAEAAKHPDIKILTYPGFNYGMMIFNLRDPANHAKPHPVFADVAVRRALTMALDRASMLRSVYDSLAALAPGPAIRAMPTTDTTLAQIPYDPAAAARALDSLGWRDANGDGVREKNGRPLAFTLIAPSSSKPRGQYAVLIQEQLKRVGAKVDVQTLEMNAFARQEAQHDFDAGLQVWRLDPSPGGLRQTWATPDPKAEGSNYGTYTSARFDALLDSALAAPTLAAARPRFAQLYRTIIADAPAVWLYDLKGILAVHGRIRTAPLRPDGWWVHLEDWWIPAGERIARDRIGTQQPS